MKRFISNLHRRATAVVVAVAAVAMVPAALVWRGRAELLEAAGAVALAVYVDALLHRGGLLVAAVAMLLKGSEIDRRARSDDR